MANVYQGQLTAAGVRVGIVVARFNELVTQQLLRGAEDAIQRHGGDAAAVDVAWVPGSFEIPVVAQRMARSGRYDAVVCVGALIRGATDMVELRVDRLIDANEVLGLVESATLPTVLTCRPTWEGGQCYLPAEAQLHQPPL